MPSFPSSEMKLFSGLFLSLSPCQSKCELEGIFHSLQKAINTSHELCRDPTEPF